MIKLLSTVALAQMTTAAITGDFISGLETGVHVTDADKFVEYNCPEPEVSDKIQSMLGIARMASGMMKAQKTDEENLIAKLDKYSEQIAVIASTFDNYDGGDFCAGLTVGYEGRSLAQGVILGFAKGKLSKHK